MSAISRLQHLRAVPPGSGGSFAQIGVLPLPGAQRHSVSDRAPARLMPRWTNQPVLTGTNPGEIEAEICDGPGIDRLRRVSAFPHDDPKKERSRS
ncbi:hypothetical protein [Paracoccus aminophilus]|uniref:hypothetical protein n=1 Tax=Paracoccus aminophilus TaxID=34003 RepID=UPI0011DD6CE3|nr:hypothetical protein [Paracoccus aminophilus]